MPEKIAMDKSGANKAAIDEINDAMAVSIIVRRVKYLNNIIKQDHRAIKLMAGPMLGFKSSGAAANVLAGIELMHMIRKGQFPINGATTMSFADKFWPSPTTTDTFDRYDVPIGGITWHVKDGCFQKSSSPR